MTGITKVAKSFMDNEFLSLKEVASIFGVHINTIRNAVKKGFIVSIRIGNGKRSPYRISRKCIDKIHENIISNQFIKHLDK